MITLKNIIEKLNLQVLSGKESLDRRVSSGYCCDLLSWVIANGKKDSVWITVQTHTNIIAVASLLELAGIIIPSGIPVDSKTIEKAEEEGIIVLSSHRGAFEISGILYQMGIGS